MKSFTVKRCALVCLPAVVAPCLACAFQLWSQPGAAQRGESWKVNGVLFYALLFFPIAATLAPWGIAQNQTSRNNRPTPLLSIASAVITALLAAIGLFFLVRPNASHWLAFLELAVAHCAALAACFELLRVLGLHRAFAHAITATLALLVQGSLFYMNPYIEKLGEAAGRAEFIHALLTWNPFSALAYGGLDGLQWLHSPVMYQLSVIGPYYGFRYPSLHACASYYAAVAFFATCLSMILLRYVERTASSSANGKMA